jgi:aminopeptidase N
MLLALLTGPVLAQQVALPKFDISHYVIDATLMPNERRINATADVTFAPVEATRSVNFELNGSLKVESVTRIGGGGRVVRSATSPRATATPAATLGNVTFIQDQAGSSSVLGPSVRVDLGDTIAANTPVTLRFKYSGILELPAGGPNLSKRFAYIGTSEGYLMYAARWFPFNDYAADRATADITISLPAGLNVAGYSDSPVTNTGGRYRFVNAKPALIGTFAYTKAAPRSVNYGGYDIQFFAKPGNEALIPQYGETLGKALENYTRRFGNADFGRKFTVVQIDDESLEYYSAPGMLMIASRPFEAGRDATADRIQREAAFQWWGQTVGLKAFEDSWLSQSLAEYSAFSLRESTTEESKRDLIRRELLEKALTFEQTASVLRAPATLDDLSTAYQYIMYGKGAFVYKLLRDTMGEQKFDQLLRTYLNEYRGKGASIDDFEKLASRIHGSDLRYFFARWVEGTGVPEFSADYQILRTRGGKFVARGTVKQNYENLRLPVDVQLRSEGEYGLKTETVAMDDTSADFNIDSQGKPLKVVIDPGFKLLRISQDLRVSSIARRGIEQFKEGNYVEAQQQFEAALKLDRNNSWVYYHLGLLFLDQRNYDVAIDNFKAALSGNLNPPWLAVWSNIKMGNAYDAKGDRTRATAAYKRAQALGDDYDKAQDAVKRYQAAPYDPKERQTTAVR